MSKSYRIFAYFCIGLIITIFSSLGSCAPGAFTVTNMNICNTDLSGVNAGAAEYISRACFGSYQLTDLGGDHDIKVSTSDIQIDSSKLKFKLAYSPVVAIFPESFYTKSNFTELKTSENNGLTYRMTDMKQTIEALIKSEDGIIDTESLGFITDKKTEIRLGIPDRASIYRKDVINSIIYILSDGEDITEANKTAIKEQLSIVLYKSVQLKNALTTLEEEQYIIMLPEYSFNDAVKFKHCPRPVYWSNCYASNMYLYTKNGLEYIKELQASIEGDNTFFKGTGYRNSNRAIKKREPFQSYTADNVVYRESQDNLEELLGQNYWLK